jgi:hypothetical protein
MDHICRALDIVDVQIENEEEPYEATRALDSDDDRPVQEMSEQEIELIRCLCLERDPVVHEFSSLSHSNGAYAEGRDDELLEALDNADNIEIKVDLLFKDLLTLRRWLQEYSVNRKRPFKVRHSYAQRCTQLCARCLIVIGGYVRSGRRKPKSLRSQKTDIYIYIYIYIYILQALSFQ